jgi:hypothetical protein
LARRGIGDDVLSWLETISHAPEDPNSRNIRSARIFFFDGRPQKSAAAAPLKPANFLQAVLRCLVKSVSFGQPPKAGYGMLEKLPKPTAYR